MRNDLPLKGAVGLYDTQPAQYIAIINDTAFSGVGVISFEYGIEDICVNEYFDSTSRSRVHSKIYTDTDGRSYIRRYGRKYFLDEFIRV